MLDLFCSSKRQDNAKSSEPGSYKAKDNNENTIICGALSIEMIDNNVCVYWKSSSTRNYWPIPPWSRVSLPRLALLAIGPGVPFPHECINDLRPRCTYCHLTPASLVILWTVLVTAGTSAPFITVVETNLKTFREEGVEECSEGGKALRRGHVDW